MSIAVSIHLFMLIAISVVPVWSLDVFISMPNISVQDHSITFGIVKGAIAFGLPFGSRRCCCGNSWATSPLESAGPDQLKPCSSGLWVNKASENKYKKSLKSVGNTEQVTEDQLSLVDCQGSKNPWDSEENEDCEGSSDLSCCDRCVHSVDVPGEPGLHNHPGYHDEDDDVDENDDTSWGEHRHVKRRGIGVRYKTAGEEMKETCKQRAKTSRKLKHATCQHVWFVLYDKRISDTFIDWELETLKFSGLQAMPNIPF